MWKKHLILNTLLSWLLCFCITSTQLCWSFCFPCWILFTSLKYWIPIKRTLREEWKNVIFGIINPLMLFREIREMHKKRRMQFFQFLRCAVQFVEILELAVLLNKGRDNVCKANYGCFIRKNSWLYGNQALF